MMSLTSLKKGRSGMMGSTFVCRHLISCKADKAGALLAGCPFLYLLNSGLGHLAVGVGVVGTAVPLQANRRGCLGVSATVSSRMAGVGLVGVDSSLSMSGGVRSCFSAAVSARGVGGGLSSLGQRGLTPPYSGVPAPAHTQHSTEQQFFWWLAKSPAPGWE